MQSEEDSFFKNKTNKNKLSKAQLDKKTHLFMMLLIISFLYCNSKYYHSSSDAYLEPCRTFIMELF